MKEITDYSLKSLEDKLLTYGSLTPDIVEFIKTKTKVFRVKKNQLLVQTGQISRYYYFILEGLLSYFYITEEGEKVIKRFYTENSFTGSLSSSITQTESLFGLEALEDSVVIRIPHHDFRAMLKDYLPLALIYIGYLESQWVIDVETEEIFLKTNDSSKRYQDFVNKYASIVKRLKQHHIASYLGVTPTQLSRITKKD